MVATTVLVAVLMTETVLDSLYWSHKRVCRRELTATPVAWVPTGMVATTVLVAVLMTVTSLLP